MDDILKAICPEPLTAEDEALVASLIDTRESANPEDRRVLDLAENIIKQTVLLDQKVKGQWIQYKT